MHDEDNDGEHERRQAHTSPGHVSSHHKAAGYQLQPDLDHHDGGDFCQGLIFSKEVGTIFCAFGTHLFRSLFEASDNAAFKG